jgi:hypothetical protein
MPTNKTISVADLKKTACWHLNTSLEQQPKKVCKPRRPTKEVQWVENELRAWCEKKGFELVPEFRFDPTRKWRIDWYVKELNACCEYEGIVSSKSRHTTIGGYSGDTDKYREVAKMGFLLLRYTALNFRNIIADLEEISDKNCNLK